MTVSSNWMSQISLLATWTSAVLDHNNGVSRYNYVNQREHYTPQLSNRSDDLLFLQIPCVCDFRWTAGVWVWFSITTSGHTCLSRRVGMIFKQEWQSTEAHVTWKAISDTRIPLINRYGMYLPKMPPILATNQMTGIFWSRLIIVTAGSFM